MVKSPAVAHAKMFGQVRIFLRRPRRGQYSIEADWHNSIARSRVGKYVGSLQARIVSVGAFCEKFIRIDSPRTAANPKRVRIYTFRAEVVGVSILVRRHGHVEAIVGRDHKSVTCNLGMAYG